MMLYNESWLFTDAPVRGSVAAGRVLAAGAGRTHGDSVQLVSSGLHIPQQLTEERLPGEWSVQTREHHYPRRGCIQW